MKVKIIKPHHKYSGEVDLLDGEANYLIQTKVAEKVKKETKVDKTKLEKK